MVSDQEDYNERLAVRNDYPEDCEGGGLLYRESVCDGDTVLEVSLRLGIGYRESVCDTEKMLKVR